MKKDLSYLECVRRVIGDNCILCNNLASDDAFMENVYMYYLEKYPMDEEEEEYYDIPEIYQFYITNCSEDDIRYNDEVLNGALDLVYNDSLDLYILCVTHFGTGWAYVHGTTIED